MNRREIFYDIFVGKESQPLSRGASSEEAQAAKELFRDVRIKPRIVSVPDFDRERDEPEEK